MQLKYAVIVYSIAGGPSSLACEMATSVYTGMPDITKKITCNIKEGGDSVPLFIDPAKDKNHSGGNALAYLCL